VSKTVISLTPSCVNSRRNLKFLYRLNRYAVQYSLRSRLLVGYLIWRLP